MGSQHCAARDTESFEAAEDEVVGVWEEARTLAAEVRKVGRGQVHGQGGMRQEGQPEDAGRDMRDKRTII